MQWSCYTRGLAWLMLQRMPHTRHRSLLARQAVGDLPARGEAAVGSRGRLVA